MDFNLSFFTDIEGSDVSTAVTQLQKQPKKIDHQLKRKIVVMDKSECLFLQIDDISYVEASGAYTNIYLINGKKMVVCKNIKTFTERLPEDEFVRVHKSYIVNINAIAKYVKSDGGYLVLDSGETVPVSVRKKQAMTDLIHQFGL